MNGHPRITPLNFALPPRPASPASVTVEAGRAATVEAGRAATPQACAVPEEIETRHVCMVN